MNHPHMHIDLYEVGKALLFAAILAAEEVVGTRVAEGGLLMPYRDTYHVGGDVVVLQVLTVWLFYLRGKRL